MTTRHAPSTLSALPILSVDIGRTSTKACVSRQPEGVVLIPANVAQLSGEQGRRERIEAAALASLLDIWVEYQGQSYAVGQLAADYGAKLGLGQSKVENALLKVLACVGYFTLHDEIVVVLNLPYHGQEQFEREKELVTRLLRAPHVLLYRGQHVFIHIKQVWVVPEGYGSLIWGEAQAADAASPLFRDRSVAVVDIGHQTTDFLMVDQFRLARGASQSEPFAMSQFYEQVAAQIQGADSQSLLLIEAVHRPPGERFYRPKGTVQPTNLDELLPRLRRSFARDLSNRLITWLPERVTDVIVSGGGGEFLWPDLQALLQEARLRAHLVTPSRMANALGQFLYGEVQRAVHSPLLVKVETP